MTRQQEKYLQPNIVERLFNRLFGLLVRLGVGLPHNYILEVRGRKSGRLHSTPVNLLNFKNRLYLVSGRGGTQWVRNARASGRITLKKGWKRIDCKSRVLSDEEKPEVLKAYLDRFTLTVQRYFPVKAGSPREAFVPFAGDYPVFELLPLRNDCGC